MQLNDLLKAQDVDCTRTLVLRHRPSEALLRKALPMLLGERRKVFDFYQAYQGEKVEQSILARQGGWLASFIAYGTAKAISAGLYTIEGHTSETETDFWSHPENRKLAKLGQEGFKATTEVPRRIRLHLRPVNIKSDWTGKLVVGWSAPERSW